MGELVHREVTEGEQRGEERSRGRRRAVRIVDVVAVKGPEGELGRDRMGEGDGEAGLTGGVAIPGPRIYSCCNCRCHVADHDEIISKCFQVSNSCNQFNPIRFPPDSASPFLSTIVLSLVGLGQLGVFFSVLRRKVFFLCLVLAFDLVCFVPITHEF